MLGFGIILPLLPFYAEKMGASPLRITIMVASFSATQLLAAPLWGRVSDRIGRKPILVGGLFASAVSYLIFGLAGSYWWLLFSRITAGAAGGNVSVAQAYVADITTHDERAAGLGHLGAATGLGVMMGPAVGGFFSTWGLGAPGFVAAGLCLLNALAAYFFVPESRPQEHRGRKGQASTWHGWVRSMTSYPLWLLLVVYFLTISSFNSFTSILALFFERKFAFNQQNMGLLFTITGGTTVVVRGFLLGPLVKRFGERATTRIGCVALIIALVAVPLLPSGNWVYFTVPWYAFGAGTLFPALASLVSRATDADSQGSIMGGSQLVGGLGRVIGPLWSGWAFQTLGISTPFAVGAAFVLMGLMLSFRIPPPLARGTQARPNSAAT
jgi:predicted MFS family arabinose efflux permease